MPNKGKLLLLIWNNLLIVQALSDSGKDPPLNWASRALWQLSSLLRGSFSSPLCSRLGPRWLKLLEARGPEQWVSMEIGINLNFDMFYLTHILHAFLIAPHRQWSEPISNENCINVRISNPVFGFPFSRRPHRQTEAPFQEGIMEVCVLIYSVHFVEGLLIWSL